MATTPNFGWSTPDNTGLVKNGALDIRTLGNSIDASLVDLKGGTTGQVLSKATNTDMDFTWVAQDDSNAIQNAIVDAKGDIIAATANDTPARLAVGANNTVLTADSSTATGLKWAAVASSGTNLGYKVNTSGSNYSTTSTTFVNVDTTNMRVAITAPSSGAVACWLTAIGSNGGSGGNNFWTVSAGAGTSYEITAINGTYLSWFSGTRCIVITGLTSGTSYNLDWQFRTSSGTAEIYSSVTTDRPKMIVTAL